MTRRVRVLHFASDESLNPWFGSIGANADRSRFDVRFATLGPSPALERQSSAMGLEAFELGVTGRRRYPIAALTLAKRLRGERIDIVHTHLLDGCLVGLLAARLARTPVAVLTAHHQHESPLHDNLRLAAAERLCAGPLSDGIIAPSRQMRDTVVAVHGAPPAKVSVIHHGFDFARLDPALVDATKVRGELGLNGRLVLGSIGRLFWVKNYEALVRAFAGIATGTPEAVLVIVGAGDPAPLRGIAQSLGVEDRVRVLPRREDVPELLAAFDLFVHPALAESFGLVIVEAMAMGKPVASTPVGIAPELVEDGVTGVPIADPRPASIEGALEHALSLRERWPAMGTEARARARAFPAARMVSEQEALYTKLLESTRGRTVAAARRP